MNFIRNFFPKYYRGIFFILSFFLYLLPAGAETLANSEKFKELRSAHFIIQYEPQVDKNFVAGIKEEAEHLYKEITQTLHLVRDKVWIWDNRAKIIIAQDKESYGDKFNCQSWSTACVDYRQKIIYTFPSQRDFSSTLAHELAHIIFREYAGYSKFPLWLDEGMAMYIQYKDTPQKELIIVEMKKNIRDNNYIKFSEIQRIYSLSDDDPRVELFYRQSFSMVYFIMEEFGKFNFKRILAYLKEGEGLGEAMEKALFVINDTESFQKAWKRFYRK